MSKLFQLSTGVYFYGDNLEDPNKTWIDPGAIELFLRFLYSANKQDKNVLDIIQKITPEYLESRWFIIPHLQEYHARYWISIRRIDEYKDELITGRR